MDVVVLAALVGCQNVVQQDGVSVSECHWMIGCFEFALPYSIRVLVAPGAFH